MLPKAKSPDEQAATEKAGRVLGWLFQHGMLGLRFEPALVWNGTYAELCGKLDGNTHHNDAAWFLHANYLFQDDPPRNDIRPIIGVRLLCQCQSCLLSQTYFCFDHHLDLIAQGRRETSIILEDRDAGEEAASYHQRELSLFEEQLRTKRATEKDIILSQLQSIVSEMNGLRSQVGQLQQELRVSTGGLVRTSDGSLYTRQQLGSMLADQTVVPAK